MQNLFVILSVALTVDCQGATKITAHVEEHLNRKVEPSIYTMRGAAKTGFTRIRIPQAKVFPHHYSSCRFLRLVDGK